MEREGRRERGEEKGGERGKEKVKREYAIVKVTITLVQKMKRIEAYHHW